ncbi:MAG: oligosaccharide flippase family protein [Silvibacterium sp.]|nr:oligosaccharide flippase family protein [Silvibacterium sp.]
MADLPQNLAAPNDEPAPHPVLRALATSFAVYGAANFGIRALNFLLILLYSRYLRPSDYGIVYLAEIVASFLAIFAGLSIDSALQRLYFQHNQTSEELGSYIGSATRFGFCWMAAFVGFVLITGRSLQSHLPAHASIPFYPYIALAIATAVVIQGVQFRLAIYQAARRPRSYSLLSLLLAVLTAAGCIYEVVLLRAGALGMLRGKLFAAVITLLIAAWTMRPFVTARFRWSYVRESLSFGVPLVPHLVMASALVVADRFILEHYRNLTEVGIYSLAYTFGMVMFLVTQSLSQAWLPIFFDLAGSDSQANRILLGRICSGLTALLSALACMGILLSPIFINFCLDPRYRSAAAIVPLVVMGYLFHGLFSLFDLCILHAKRTASVFAISLIAFAVNLALNFAMIPRWGMYGAAWATTLAYAVEALGAFLLAQRFFPLSWRIPEILAAIAICGAALWLTQSSPMLQYHGMPLVPSAILVLVLLALISRNDLRIAMSAMRRRARP